MEIGKGAILGKYCSGNKMHCYFGNTNTDGNTMDGEGGLEKIQ